MYHLQHLDPNQAHFEEVFEESELSQGSYYRQMPDNEPPHAIQLIRIRPSGQIEVDENGLSIISNCDLPVGFVCLCGKYRTGKSFLLNKLLKQDGKGVIHHLNTV